MLAQAPFIELVYPRGFNALDLRFSWKLRDARAGAAQTAYRIQVAPAHTPLGPKTGAEDLLWDSGEVVDEASLYRAYLGPCLESHARYQWRTRIRDHTGTLLPWSDSLWFETAFPETVAEWPGAQWIAADQSANLACPYLRKRFTLESLPRSARLYITARGLFEAHLNGQRIGADYFTPGWTDYEKRSEYLTYDVTSLLVAGANTMGVILAGGWYAGCLGWNRDKPDRQYGERPSLLAVLRLELVDGSIRWLGSNQTWEAARGALLSSDLYQGEHYDARLEMDGWSNAVPGDAGQWRPVTLAPPVAAELNARQLAPVQAIEERSPTAVHRFDEVGCIVDFGQNLVGVVRLRVLAPAGTRITIRHGEMLQADGSLYTANLRSARATDTYVCRGLAMGEVYTPHFTFHGFRYVEVSGLVNVLSPEDIAAVVLHSNLQPTGSFTTSHPLLNRLQQCIRWGQISNFLEVPTDCPQRDERLGWTGDAQIFLTTAAFNYDIAEFFRKWLRDLVDAQRENGAFPDVAPDALKLMYGSGRRVGNAGWADAGVICPWLLYQSYGDEQVLARHYQAMVRWIDYQESTSDGLIRPATSFGDWLALDGGPAPSGSRTPGELIGTAYFAHTTGLMALIANVLGRTTDARRFASLRSRIIVAFNARFVDRDGRVAGDTQTAYLLALGFDLLPSARKPEALAHLEATLTRHDHHLSTGFLGTPLLAPVLTRMDRLDLAYRLVLNESYPSWLFPVVHGATTMWERWNSWTPETGFGEVGMNSFNHYAYGAIGDWFYRTVAGLDQAEPGYRCVLLRPRPGGGLRAAAASLETPYGLARSSWEITATGFAWEIVVPPNTSALVMPPGALAALNINGIHWSANRAFQRRADDDGRPVLHCRAGRYLLHLSSWDNAHVHTPPHS